MTPEEIKELAKAEVSPLGKELGRINDLVSDISKLTTYVILVLLVMVATMLVTLGGTVYSAYQNQAATNQNLNLQILQLQKCLQNRADC